MRLNDIATWWPSFQGGGGETYTPITLSAVADNNDEITLTWSDLGYDVIIERSTNQVDYSVVDTVSSGLGTFTDSGLDGATRYFYRGRKAGETYSNVAYALTWPDIIFDGNTDAIYDWRDVDNITKDESNIISRVNNKLGESLPLVNGSATYDEIEGFMADGIDDYLSTDPASLPAPHSLYLIFKQVTWTSSKTLHDGVGLYANNAVIITGGLTGNMAVNFGASSNTINGGDVGSWQYIRALINGAGSKFIFGETEDVGNFGSNNMGGIKFFASRQNTKYGNFNFRIYIKRSILDSDANALIIYNWMKDLTEPVAPVTSVGSRSLYNEGVRLTWTDSGDYDVSIYRSLNGGAITHLADVNNGVETYDDTTTSIDDEVSYYVYARDVNLLSEPVREDITVSSVARFTSIQPSVVDNVALRIAVTTGKVVFLDKGDGSEPTQLSANGGSFTYNTNYSSGDNTYTIELYGELDGLVSFTVSTDPTFTVNVNELWKFTNIVTVSLRTINAPITGSLDSLPSTLEELDLVPISASYGELGNNKITGTDVVFPSGLTRLVLKNLIGYGDTSLTFSVDDLPSGMTYMDLSVAGDGVDNPNITGDLDNVWTNCPNFENYLQQGAGHIAWSGTVAQPETLTEFYTENVIDPWYSGDLETLLSTNLTKLFLVGNSPPADTPDPSKYLDSNFTGTLSGISARCPDLEFLWLTEGFCNPLTGQIDDLGSSLTTTVIGKTTGSFAYNGGSLPAWADNTITIGCSLSTSEVDDFLNTWALTAGAGVKTITLADNNEARSSASDAAVATLEGLGKTIQTN